MSDFLEKIMACKRREVEEHKVKYSEIALRVECGDREDYRSFYSALARDEINIIAEVKKASPSKGDIQPDLIPAEMARLYEEGGAAAISVLTEKDFFKGGLDDMRAVRAACNIPVLRKDFIFDPYQVYEASANKADAILLIARILDKELLEDLLALTHALGIDALVEIHGEADLEKIDGIGAKIIGINNRDLSSFNTNLDVAIKMAENLKEDQIVVAASGIFSYDDIKRYPQEKIHSFLVGESIVRAENRVEFLKSLRGL